MSLGKTIPITVHLEIDAEDERVDVSKVILSVERRIRDSLQIFGCVDEKLNKQVGLSASWVCAELFEEII